MSPSPRNSARPSIWAPVPCPNVSIQAAFGRGKTVVCAIIAARRVNAGKRVLVTAGTNAAVAQFAQTILSLTAYRHLRVLRFVSDTAAQDNLTPTPLDMNKILMSLDEEFDEQLTNDKRELCDRFTAGRTILEQCIKNPDLAVDMSEDHKEGYALAERNISRTVQKMIKLM
ncbi:hypothetical protein Y032_0053g2377 [Ancylostoma ceylanicum]|uniref:DEAD/DEAH-box helicase domain-containing protein n=1 Tax=Ancylostoma ceylanicum TaxID=53326 RepID=A0A016U8J9_9BILA|nr:hypothetical protein Y032_0053g2377 [Ancylostoma ceylanicum]